MPELLTREVSGGFIRGFCENGIEKFLGIPFGKVKRFESPEKFVGNWSRENPLDCFVSYNYPQNIENCKRSNALIPKYNDFDTIKFSEENELRLCVYSKRYKLKKFPDFFFKIQVKPVFRLWFTFMVEAISTVDRQNIQVMTSW